ncbi:MAG: DUF2807 domain-containing protein [Bacteroidales bacterium]|jgi:hypothetical protein|nr:DUF2807 domain-containing protein [Bacteroidales bacterium]
MGLRLSKTKKDTFSVLAVMSLSFMISTACAGNRKWIKASKTYTSKTIYAEKIQSVSSRGNIDIILTQKPGKPVIEIYGPDNIVPLVVTQINGTDLDVSYKRHTSIIMQNQTIEVRITVPDLEKASLYGSGDIKFHSAFKNDHKMEIGVNGSGDIIGETLSCREISLRTNGSGDVSFKALECSDLKIGIAGSGDASLENISCDNCRANIAGSGDIELSGKCGSAVYHIAGSGDINAKNLHAASVTATIAGSGDIDCFASENIEGHISGSGDINPFGNPKRVYIK